MFTSMNSSFTSEVYSIDVGVETDSDMEWITPEMMVFERNARLNSQPSTSSMQIAAPSHFNNNFLDIQVSFLFFFFKSKLYVSLQEFQLKELN